MTVRTVETTGGRGGDRGGLRGSPKNASTRATLAQIMARKRPNNLAVEQKEHLLISRSVVELSKRPTMVVGPRPSGKSRDEGRLPMSGMGNGSNVQSVLGMDMQDDRASTERRTLKEGMRMNADGVWRQGASVLVLTALALAGMLGGPRMARGAGSGKRVTLTTNETVSMELPEILMKVRKHGEIITVAPGNKHWAWNVGGVMVDGRIKHKRHQKVGKLVFSPDGERLVYSAKTKDGYRLIVNGAPSKGDAYEEIKNIEFSPTGKHLAFAAKRSGKWHVVVDGVRGKAYDKVAWGPIFAPGSGRLAYEVEKNDKAYMVVGGKENGPFTWMEGGFSFSPNGRRFAYGAYNGKDFAVVIDGKPGKSYSKVSRLAFSADGGHVAHAAKKGNSWYLIADGKQRGRGYKYPFNVYLGSGGKIIHGAFDGGKYRVVTNGREGKLYDSGMYGGTALSPDRRHLATVVMRKEKSIMLLDGAEGKAYEELDRPVFSPDSKRLAYKAKAARQWAAVVDGVKGKTYTKLGSHIYGAGPVFSPDSKHIAYAAKMDDKWTVVVDGVEAKKYDKLLGGSTITFNGSDALDIMAMRGNQLLLVHISITGK